MSNRIHYLALAVICCAGLLGYATLTRGHNWGGDFALYIEQARSIVERNPDELLAVNRFTVEESSYPMSPVAYPWGTPLLLSPLVAACGMDMLCLKALNLVCYVLFLVVLWFGLCRRLPRILSVLVLLLFALNPDLLSSLNNILSDIPFLLFSTLTLVLMDRAIVEERPLFSPIADRVLLGLSLALSYAIRTNGILLVVALLSIHGRRLLKRLLPSRGRGSLHTIVRGMRRVTTRDALVVALPYLVFAGFTVGWRMLLPEGGTSHFAHLDGVSLSGILPRIRYYAEVSADFYSGLPGSRELYLATLPFLAVGIAYQLKRDYHLVVYALLTLLLYTVWPSIEGLRFLYPILPIYAYLWLSGLDAVQRLRPLPMVRRVLSATVLVAAAIVVVWFTTKSVYRAVLNIANRRVYEDQPYSASAQDVFSYIRLHTTSKDVIVFWKPRVMRLFTGRQSVLLDDPAQMHKADYLCYTWDPRLYDHQLAPNVVERLVRQGNLLRVYTNGGFSVYRIAATNKEEGWGRDEHGSDGYVRLALLP